METQNTNPVSTDSKQEGLNPPDLRLRILEVATDMFSAQGYSKISMNEIVQELRISKKTLYREFKDKEELLRAVLFPKMLKSAEETDRLIADESIPYMKKLERLMEMICLRASSSSNILIRDLATSAPAVWQEYMQFKRSRMQRFQLLVEAGIRTAHLRNDTSPELVTRFYIAALEAVVNPATLAELPFTSREVAQALVTMIFEGLMTEEARKELHAPTSGAHE